VTAFILGDVALHRDGIAGLLDADPLIRVVGVAAPGPTTVARISQLRPDVVVLDVAGASPYAHARAIGDAAPGVKVVAIGISGTASELARCAQAGVGSYVTPESTVADLTSALTRRVVTAAEVARPPGRGRRLTRREAEVVDLVARGLTNKEIALALGIGVATVKTHVHHVLGKLRLRRRSELVAYRLNGSGSTPRVHPMVDAARRAETGQ
jgi:DNA-binding NarL/FixJ family response regulator